MLQGEGSGLQSRTALTNMVATSHKWIFKFKLNKIKNSVISHNSHISSAQEPCGLSGYCIGQQEYITFSSLQKLLLDGIGLKNQVS